jgi:hypothetical protein
VQITKEQYDALVHRLDKVWPEPRRCPVCGKTDWTLLDRVMELREFERGSLSVGGKLIPLITLTCATCANTVLFNAIGLGVVESQPPASQKPAREGVAP